VRERGARGRAADRKRARGGDDPPRSRGTYPPTYRDIGGYAGVRAGGRGFGRSRVTRAGIRPRRRATTTTTLKRRAIARPRRAARATEPRGGDTAAGGMDGNPAAETIIISPEPCGRRRERGRWPCGRRRPGPSCRSGSRRGPRRRRRAWRRKTWFAATPVGRSVQRSVEYDFDVTLSQS